MVVLALSIAVATEPSAHEPGERVLIDTMKVGSASAPLVVGPCTSDGCALQVEGAGSARAQVWPIDPEDMPFVVVDVDHGWMIRMDGNLRAGMSIAWEPVPGLAPRVQRS